MKTPLLFLLTLGLMVAPVIAWAEDTEGEDDSAEFGWLSDYEEAQAKARETKKGLFIYLTPNWFR